MSLRNNAIHLSAKANRFLAKNLTKLVNYFLEELNKGKVLKIYPFLGLIGSLIDKKPTKLRCGAGYANFTITTTGKLSACPIMNSVKDFYCGDIKSGATKEIYVGEPCTSCKYLYLCGGRCLYSNYAKLWPEDGQKLICETIIHLINEIKRIFPQIKKLIEKGIVNEGDFSIEKYFGPEIIP